MLLVWLGNVRSSAYLSAGLSVDLPEVIREPGGGAAIREIGQPGVPAPG